MPTADAAQLDRAFHPLADESRRAMVVRLSRGAASVSELAAPLDMSLPSVMQHLDVLQRSGLVRSEKVGRVRRCRLAPGPMRTLEEWIAEHRAIWERHFDRLSDVLDDAFCANLNSSGSVGSTLTRARSASAFAMPGSVTSTPVRASRISVRDARCP